MQASASAAAIDPADVKRGSFTICCGAMLGALGVMSGAFGAHALRDILSQSQLHTWEVAAHYHLVHSLAAVGIGLFHRVSANSHRVLVAAGSLMVVGVVVFSGSLYVLVLTDLKMFGMFTPVGGVAMISAWLTLAYACVRDRCSW
jgi:uncharacterized membrane protein YgdD (TMEM256/DUF423 family)